IAGASALLGGEPGSDTFHPDHMPDATPETFAKNIAVDPGFLDLMHIPLLAGRNFQTDNPADRSVAYIINETAVKQFQLRDPIGENFRRRGDSTGRIIGVMKDFHFASMSENIHPMVFYMDTLRSYRYMFVRMHGDIPAAIDGVKEAWASVMPEWPMEGFFQDEYFNALYKQEEQLQRITGWFSVLAMALAALGLLGLSSFVILHRTKEIGIRKVIGASVPDILVLLSAHFLKLIFFSLLISIPLTVFLIDQWLQGFVARISIGAGYFLVAGICTTAVALITIGFQSIRAALANPVNAIRGE
ncbi:MAG TPA: FtsX-like permease family protein, partial [Chryseosolibacter sp.]|nr:FtsX-like permease family protein [Chryseosolibacter sp.]